MKTTAVLFLISLAIFVDADVPDCPKSCMGKCSYKETPGSLPIDVSADGQGGMTATIGLQVPRGTGGREPGFTLKYSNNAGNGRLGLGWELSYLPAIARCPKRHMENGVSAKVSFTVDDVFCVSGNQLVLVNGTDASLSMYDGTQYYADRYDRILYQPFGPRKTRLNRGVTGPEYWIASMPNGVVHVYGQTPDSRVTNYDGVVLSWEANCEMDPFGNAINLTYVDYGSKGARDRYLSKIKYAEETASIEFNYETRPDPIVSYFSGMELLTSRRLTTISTFSAVPVEDGFGVETAPVPVFVYVLSYATSSLSGVSLLESVQLCSGCFELCQPPLRLTYESPPSNDVLNLGFPYDFETNSSDTSMFVRFLPGITPYSPDGFPLLALCSVHGHEPIVYPSQTVMEESNVQLTVDADGDGVTDLLFVQYDATFGLNTVLFLSKGDGNFHAVTSSLRKPTVPLAGTPDDRCAWGALQLYADSIYENTHDFFSTSLNVFANDITGDGNYDLTAVVLTDGPRGIITKKGRCPSEMPKVLIFYVNGTGGGNLSSQGTVVGRHDFNFETGKGCSVLLSDITDSLYQDIVITCADDKGWRVWTILGNSNFTWSEKSVFSDIVPMAPLPNGQNFSRNGQVNRILARDLDGDGSPELVMITPTEKGIEVRVSSSMVNGSFTPIYGNKMIITPSTDVLGSKALSAFFVNVPGSFTRLIVSSANESGWYVYAAQSLGNFSLSDAVALPRGPACASNTVVLAADANGDARPELLAISPGNGSVGLAVHVVALTTDEKVFGRTFSHQYPAIVSPLSSNIKLSDSIITADFTGDGRVDIALFRIPYYTNGKHSYCAVYDSLWHPVIYALPSVRISPSPFDRLTRLVDGNGLTTRINYALMTNDSVYIQESRSRSPKYAQCQTWPNASAIASPIPNVIYTPSARFLVQRIDKDNALGDGSFAYTRYVYRGFARHTRGFGSLGFQYVFAFHNETTLSQLTRHSLDFLAHMHGHPVRIETYRCADSMRQTLLISWQTNEWSSAQKLPTGATDGANVFKYGSYIIALSKQDQLTYTEDGEFFVKRETKTLLYDADGLPYSTLYAVHDASPHSGEFPTLGDNYFTRNVTITHMKPTYAKHSWYVGLPEYAVEIANTTYQSTSSYVDYTSSLTVKSATRTFDAKTGMVSSESLSSGIGADPTKAQSTVTLLYERDDRGNVLVVSSTGADGSAIDNKTMTYDDRGRFQKSLCSGAICQEWRHGHNGEVLLETSKANEKISHAYDALFREIAVVSASNQAKNVKTSFEFCQKANCPSSLKSAVYAKVVDSSVYEYYDGLNRLLGTRWVPQGSDPELIQTNQYDRFGTLSQRFPIHETSDSSNQAIHFLKDSLGRVATINETFRAFVIEDWATFWQTLAVDYSGNRVDVTVRDSSSIGEAKYTPWRQTRVTDARGLTVLTREPNIDQTLQYWYDSNSNLVAVVLRGVETALLYRATFSENGYPSTLSHSNKGTYKYVHDGRGRLVNQTDPSGNVMNFRRNEQNRVVSIFEMLPNGDGGVVLNVSYDKVFPDHIASESGVTTEGLDFGVTNLYDEVLGQLRNVTKTYAGKTVIISHVYDSSNRLQKVVYPDGLVILFQYDKINRINRLTDDSSKRVLWTAQEFDAKGRASKETLGNGLQMERLYEPATVLLKTSKYLDKAMTVRGDENRMVQAEASFSFTVYFDPSSRVSLIRKEVSGAQLYEEALTYDNSYQALTKTSRVNDRRSVSFSYGTFGNLHSKSDVGTYSYPSVASFGANAERLVETAAIYQVSKVSSSSSTYDFEYDERGNRISWNGTFVEYNSKNKPSRIVRGPFSVTFDYSPRGQLLMRKDFVNISSDGSGFGTSILYGQTWYADDLYEEELIRENLTSPTMTKKIQRYYVNSDIVLQKTTSLVSSNSKPTSAYFFLHRDAKGSLHFVTDENGDVVESFDYDVCGRRRDGRTGIPSARYGEVMSRANSQSLTAKEAATMLPSLTSKVTVQFGFDGHIQLDDIGGDLVHMGGRLFDTIHCLFLTPDPFVSDMWRSVGFNTYAYGEFNPMSGIDPSGYSFLSSIGHFFKSTFEKIVHFLEKIIDALANLLRKIPILNKILTLAIDVLAEVTGQFWLSAAWEVVEDRVQGKSWAQALADGLISIASNVIGSVFDAAEGAINAAGDFAGKSVITDLLKLGKVAVDGMKGAAKTAASGQHSLKAISMGAAKSVLSDVFSSVLKAAKQFLKPEADVASSVTHALAYSSVSHLHTEVVAVAKSVAKDVISEVAKDAAKGLLADARKSGFFGVLDDLKGDFLQEGVPKTYVSMHFSNAMNALLQRSADHFGFASSGKSSFGSRKMSEFFGEAHHFGKTLAADRMAGLDKLSASHGLSYSALRNADVVQSFFASEQGKEAKNELLFQEGKCQLIRNPMVSVESLEQDWTGQ